MTQFPAGLGIGKGRFRLERLLRGTPSDGLWTATDHERDRNEWEDHSLPFDGAAPLGHVLERALVADPAARSDLDELRSSLVRLQ